MSNKHQRNSEPVRNVLDTESKLYSGHSFLHPTDIICNVLLQSVMVKKEDDQFTLKELAQAYCNSPTITHMDTTAVYKQMYEQLLIRDLAYIGEIEDHMKLEDVIWYRQDSNGAYKLYKECK